MNELNMGIDYMLPRGDFSVWFGKMLAPRVMTASYKAFWLKGIVEEVCDPDRESGEDGFVISFERIVDRMIASAWYPITKFRLSFGVFDSLGKVVDYIKVTYGLKSNISEKDMFRFLAETSGDVQLNRMRKGLMDQVPYKLLSVFFKGELPSSNAKKDKLYKSEIVRLSNRDITCFYSIDDVAKTIRVNEGWIGYIKENQGLIQGWLKFKIAEFVGKRNPNVPNILFKLDMPLERSLRSATKYWSRFMEIQTVRDVYTGELMVDKNYEKFGVMSIDHFIPWSYVLHDEMWNLLPTFKNVNSAKSDGLPNLDRYLDEFCGLQFEALKVMKEGSGNQRVMESYYGIGRGKDLEGMLKKGVMLEEEAFVGSLKDQVLPAYQVALNQGFEVWER